MTFTLAPMTTTDWTDQRQSVGKEILEDYDPQIENPRDRELVDLSLQQVVSANSIAINPVLNLSSRQLTEEEQEVLLLGLKFAPTPKKIPDPLEFYEKYHKQCEREYNKLTHRKLDAPLPKLIEEHLMAIKTKLQDVVNVAKETPEESHAHWQNLSRRHQKALSILKRDNWKKTLAKAQQRKPTS